MEAGSEWTDVRSITGAHRDLVARVSPAVCLILHSRTPGVQHAIGTGALVRTGAGIAILTAGHVAAFGNTGELVARFDFERLDDVTRLSPGIDWRLAVAEEWVDGLDYGLAVTCETPGQPPPQNLFAPLVAGSSKALTPGDALYCVHHPHAEPKQFSAGTFVAFAGGELRYHMFTAAKSSGAPLLNVRGEIVGVHRAESSPGPQSAKFGISMDAIRRTSPGFARRAAGSRRQYAEQLESRPTS